jgi:hypothetical protein
VIVAPHTGYADEETVVNWYKWQVEIVDRWLKREVLLHVLA